MAINKAILIGNLGKDPEARTLDNGTKVVTFSLATTEKGYTTQSGQQVPDKTYWHNIVAWRQLADIIERYCHKGDKIYIEGKITSRSYENAQKQTMWTTEIVADKIELLGSRQEQQPAQPAQQQQQQPVYQPQPQHQQASDELPF